MNIVLMTFGTISVFLISTDGRKALLIPLSSVCCGRVRMFSFIKLIFLFLDPRHDREVFESVERRAACDGRIISTKLSQDINVTNTR